MHFNGRIAVVTGGGNGIGKSIVQRLAQTGCKIAVIDKQKESLDSLRQFLSKYKNDILPFQGDVTDRESLKEISEEISFKLGEPSILINNAGVLIRNTIEEKEILKSWEKTIDVNLTGVFNTCYTFLESLKKKKGAIVNIASIHSQIAINNSVAYTASKGGILQLTRALALELSPYNIRVNAVSPGIISTQLTSGIRGEANALRNFLTRVPIGRVGSPEEVADAVLFLASDMSTYITGINLPVDGGYLAN